MVSRFLAYLLDALIVAVLAGAGVIAFGLVASVVGTEARELAHTVLTTYAIFLPSLLALYCATFWLLAGRTPGMAVLRLRVVTTGGRPVRFPAALVRAVLLAYFPIGALVLLVNRRHRALHDLIARTAVVRNA